MLLFAGHDSTVMPLLIALHCFDKRWPPFAADVIFELYSQVTGPSASDVCPSTVDSCPPAQHAFPNSELAWPPNMLDNFWLRVRYLGRPVPLARLWAPETKPVEGLFGCSDLVPLRVLVDRWRGMALSTVDFKVQCQRAKGQNARAPPGLGFTGPKPV